MSYIEIANSSLSASINTLGGTIHSLQLDGVEYFWQGSEKYWPRQDLISLPAGMTYSNEMTIALH